MLWIKDSLAGGVWLGWSTLPNLPISLVLAAESRTCSFDLIHLVHVSLTHHCVLLLLNRWRRKDPGDFLSTWHVRSGVSISVYLCICILVTGNWYRGTHAKWLILTTPLPVSEGGERSPYLRAALVQGVADGVHIVMPHAATGVSVDHEGTVCFTVRISHHCQEREHGNRSCKYMISHCWGTSRW